VQLCAKMISLACEGLAYAHGFVDPGTGEPLGLVHRDISPDNLLVSSHGTLKVVDFGIAKVANQLHHTRTGLIKGKIAYMAPEQLQNKPLDARADVFALGVVLYELLSGRKPFEAEGEVGMMQAILHQPPVPMSAHRDDVPKRLCDILERALAKDRDTRYGSCRELQADLECYLHTTEEPVGARHLAQLVARSAPSQEAAARKAQVRASPTLGVAARQLAQRQEPGRGGSRRGLLAATGLLVALLGAFTWHGAKPMPPPSPPEPLVDVRPPTPTPPPEVETSPVAQPPDSTPQPTRVEPAALATDTPEPPKKTSAQARASSRASFRVTSNVPGLVRVNGRRLGRTPVEVRGIPAGKVDVEVFDARVGFSKKQTFDVRAGDNGILALDMGKGSLQLWVRPYATVMLNGKSLGQTPIAPIELYEGRYKFKLVNAELGKEKVMEYVVHAGGNHVLKANMME